MVGQLSEAGKRRGRRNALLALTIVFVLMFGMAFLLSLLLHQRWIHAFMMVWATVLGSLLILEIASWLRCHSAAGPVLLDCGRTPQGIRASIGLTACAFFGLLAGWSAVLTLTFWRHGKPAEATESALGCLFFASLLLSVPSWAHLQLRENGIAVCGSLVQWARIKSYKWDGEDGLTLLIHYDSRFPLLLRRAFLVPAEHKKKFEEVLGDHCPTAE